MVSKDVELEAYRQAHNVLLHYSSLRFTVLGAFVAISGGLFVFAAKPAPSFPALTCFAIAIAVAFSVLELRINAVAEFYAGKIDKLAAQLDMGEAASSAPPKSCLGRWLAPGVVLVVYGGSTAMWLYTWVNSILWG